MATKEHTKIYNKRSKHICLKGIDGLRSLLQTRDNKDSIIHVRDDANSKNRWSN